jgi:hypothetical protein
MGNGVMATGPKLPRPSLTLPGLTLFGAAARLSVIWGPTDRRHAGHTGHEQGMSGKPASALSRATRGVAPSIFWKKLALMREGDDIA